MRVDSSPRSFAQAASSGATAPFFKYLSNSPTVPRFARALREFQRLLHEDPEHGGTGHAEAWALLVHALAVLIDSLEQRSREPHGELHILRRWFPITHSENIA
jgi:hypothetical protein